MKHLQYLLAVLLLTVCPAAWAQFNPENPDEPGTHPWRLTLKAVPATGGYYNLNAQSMHAAGEEVYLYAYCHSGFSFVQWEDEQGHVLSTDNNLSYTMPARNIALVARFQFAPDTPEEPGQASIKRHLYLRTNPADVGWFNLNHDNDIAVGEQVYIEAYNSSQHYSFRNWTQDGNIISASKGFTYTMPDKDVTLVVNYDYHFTPDNPSEPGEPQQELYNIYGMREGVQAGHVVSYPLYLQNRGGELTGFTVDVSFPQGFIADVSAATLSDRAARQSLQVEALPGGAYRFTVSGAEAIQGVEGKVLSIPVHVPDTATIGNVFTIALADAVVFKADGTQDSIGTRSGQLKIVRDENERPDSPDYAVSDVATTASNIMPQDAVTLTWKVENLGNLDGYGGWTERIYLVAPDGRKVNIGTASYDTATLAPGATVSRSATVSLPRLPGIDGAVDLAVTIVPSVGSGESADFLSNNSSKTSGTPITVGKRLYLTAPTAPQQEGAVTTVRCLLERSGSWSTAQTFDLAKLRGDDRLAVPQTVTIPREQAAAYFYLNLADNAVCDDDSLFTIEVAGSGYDAQQATLTIRDDELPPLRLTATATEVNEGDTFQLTVSLDRPLSRSLSVALACSRPSRFSYPQTITIPAGQTEATVDLAAINDSAPSSTETVEFYATAEGYDKAGVLLLLYDDDVPDIDLLLTPDVVSEDAGANAVYATLRRTNVTDNKVTIRLTDDQSGRLFYPNTVVLEKNMTEKAFVIGVVDNNLVEGECTVNLTAEVYISSCDCGVVGTKQGVVTRQLRILDNDGPTLTLMSSQSTIQEGDDNGAVVTLTRNTLTADKLIVRLQSDDQGVMLPTQVTIPAGEQSTTFRVRARANDQQEGSRVVVVRADADGFNSGSVWLYVTDMTLPDMAVRSIAITPSTILASDDYNVAITIANAGVVEVPARSTYTIRAGQQVLTMTIAEAIAPNGQTTASLTLKAPAAPGSYAVEVECNKGRLFDEVQWLNNVRSVPLKVSPAYTYTVATDRTNYQMGQTVKISGKATAVRGASQRINVEPFVVYHGTRQALAATTDDDGHFEVDFPLPTGIGGDFAIGVCAPGEGSSEALTAIGVYGMARTEGTFIKCYMYVDEPFHINVPLKNLSSLPLHHLKATVSDDAGHYEVTAKDVDVLGGNAEGALELTLRSAVASTTGNWERVWLSVGSDEGATLNFVVYAYTVNPGAELAFNQPVIRTNITNSKPTTIPVVLTNRGAGNTGRITVAIPKNQSFIALNTPSELPSMAHGDSTVISLTFNPAGLPTNVVQSGTVAVNCENGDGQLISYSLKVVGEDKGSLLVSVEDELTIYGNAEGDHPLVGGATVQLKDYNTGIPLYTEVTTDAGTALFSDIPEGYYTLLVTAPKHDSYMQHVLVSPAETTEHLATISYQPISISYNVVETEVEDQYEIVSDYTFETQVPVPVIDLIFPDTLNLLSVEQGQELLYYVYVENKGLITANNVCVTLPTIEDFLFTPLADYAGFDLAPYQRVGIPVLVTYAPAAGQSRAKADVMVGGRKCHDKTWANWEWVCKANKTGWLGKLGYFLMRECDPLEPDPDQDKKVDTKVESTGEPTGEELDPRWYTATIEQPDWELIKEIVNTIACSLACFFPDPPDLPELPSLPSMEDLEDWIHDQIPDKYVTPVCILEEIVSNHSSSRTNQQAPAANSLRQSYLRRLELYLNLSDNQRNYYAELLNAPLLFDDNVTVNQLAPGLNTIIRRMADWHDEGTLYTKNAADIAHDALTLMPQSSADWYDFNLQTFVERQMNTWHLRDGQPVEGDNACNITTLDTCQTNIAHYDQLIAELGYANLYDMLQSMKADIQAVNEGTRNVCATVKMQIKQEMAFTRQAFRGTLTIDNSTEEAISDIAVLLQAISEDGILATSREMQINLENSEGFTMQDNGNYRLEAGQTGTFTYLFIPTKYAATDHDVVYGFGGALSFNNGEGVMTRDLYPVSLIVRPSPVLDLTYFMQRDILGDDPLTEAVEPIVPAEFALIIDNKGYGDATNVRMVTQQPVIVENEKGLLIDFQLVSSQVNGQPAVLSFGQAIANDFGTIAARSQAFAQWWLTSTLMGHFTNYDVEATHVTSYGNEDLSLLDEVSIHELIHGFTPADWLNTDATGRGFLVNDVTDAEDQPDEVYFTDGTQKSVLRAAGATISSLGQNAYLLNISPSTTGWNYGSLADPTNGQLQIASIIRRRDGASIPADNVWQTPVTLRDGKDPVHEKRLHFICESQGAAAEAWLLTFEERPEEVSIGDVLASNADERERIVITPLPLGEQMFVKGNFSEIRQLTVYDLKGLKRLQRQHLRQGEGIPTGQLPAGVYHIQVCTDRGVYTQKVLKR